MATLNFNNILQELVVRLRNANIYTVSERGVTTATQAGSLVNTATITIAVSNVKNIRSVTVNSVVQTFGSGYTVNYDSNSTCVITLPAPVSTTYSVSYDYGTDIIFPGYPRNDLTLTSFPRIHCDFIDIATDPAGFGNVNSSSFDITIIVYDLKKSTVRAKIQAIRDFIITNQSGFYYMTLVKPSLVGPAMPSNGFEKFKDKIIQQNLDIRSTFNIEVN